MANFGYYNFSGGINLRNSALSMLSDEKQVEWSDAENVEFWGTGGFSKMLGNTCILDLGEGTKILGLAEYIIEENKYLVFVYSDGTEGHFCYFTDVDGATYEIIKSGLDKDARCNFTNYLNGIAVANGVNDPFVWINDEDPPHIVPTGFKWQTGEAPITMCNFKGRLFAAVPNSGTLYYSALGDASDWTTSSDAGYVENFHGSSAPITSLQPYGTNLAIYREGEVYLLQGASPGDFVITPFGNRGSVSPFGVLNYDNKQLFFNDGVYALEYGELQQIQLSNELSIKISPGFDLLDKDRYDQITTLTYPKERQVWFYMPELGREDLSICWIMDRKDIKNIVWYKRRATPITTACVYKDEIYTGTSDGKILKENVGDTLNGENFSGYWYGPWMLFKSPKLKCCESGLDILFDGEKTNNVNMLLRYNTITSKERSKTIEAYSNLILVWGNNNWGTSVWKDNRSLVKHMIVPGNFRNLQLGFESTGPFAINGIIFNNIEVLN